MQTRRTLTAALRCVVALASLAVAACGSDRGSSPPRASSAEAAILERALGGEPATLDPRLAEDNPALALSQELFEGLTTEAADGRIVPGAAATWTVSEDGRTWTFRLRPGLHWSDGTALTAAQFVAGLDAARAKDSQAPYAALLHDVTNTRAPDSRTVVLEVARAVPYLPAVLALPVAAPQRRADSTTDASIVGNGPYRLRMHRPGEKIELERNPHYHSAGAVAIERVTYLTLDDLNTELNLYRTGELDITSEVPNSQIDWLRQNLSGELHIAPYLSTYAYALNLRRVQDRDVRAALSLAVDREQITDRVTGAGELPAQSWVPPGIPGYAPARAAWAGLDTGARTRQAQEHWSAARKRGAARAQLTLCTDASANHRRTAVALADQWRQALGVEVAIVEMEWKAYLVTREQPGECDLLRYGWSADFVDPEAFLALFTSGHAQNVAGYSNPAYDALLSRSGVAVDADLRAATLASAERILLQDAVVIPVFHRVSKRLVKPGIDGIAANPLGHLPSRHLRLRETKK
jgi:oligopeptide transport system substrate-binding protein